MEYKEDMDFYQSLSKKKLQDLCKRYGLSPCMTKSNLVNSLCSYFKKKNLSSVSHDSIVCSTSLIPPLECGANSDNVEHAPKDSYLHIYCPGEKDNRENLNRTVKCNEQESFRGADNYNEASGFKIVRDLECPLYNVPENSLLACKRNETLCSQNELACSESGFGNRVELPKISSGKNSLSFAREAGVSDATQIQCRNLNGASLAENASTSSIISSKAIPSFKFHVSSDEGINLIIDLNSSPSDWPKRLENEVCGCQNTHDNKFGSLREELELFGNSGKRMKKSFIWNTDSEREINNDHVQSGSSSYSNKRECDPVVVDNQYGADGSLRSSPTKLCNVAKERSTQFKKDKELLLFSRPTSDVQNRVTSGEESCAIDRETLPLELGVINTPQIKSSSNSTPLEHQNSVVGYKNDDLTVQNTCTHVSPSLLYPGSSSTGSMEMQCSDVVCQQKHASCSPCRNKGFPDVVDPMLNVETRDYEFSNSSTCQHNMSVCSEEWEMSKLNGAETSESLHLKNSLEKTPENSEAGVILKRKRQDSEGAGLNCCGELNVKNLRSRKRLPERVLPRRSTRLISK